jgi:hypothetical protein
MLTSPKTPTAVAKRQAEGEDVELSVVVRMDEEAELDRPQAAASRDLDQRCDRDQYRIERDNPTRGSSDARPGATGSSGDYR